MKIMYWSSTILISSFLFFSSYTYVFNKSTIDGIRALGFPDFFRIELAALKTIAAILLLIPNISLQIKEWTYAGVGFFLITAIVAHLAHKDSMLTILINLILITLLVISNMYLPEK
ncbi:MULTISPECIES: DoxX family protein [Aquimarina]|uniref:DoxX family protein n=1 Tax=Aquimarina algiphila TaxID=2047982 RepID=A0A554VCN4_9FLAO|nr:MULTISPECIES: DoxX family protein [Aquimarina]TSE04499.1 DoxX family protein [Aquimarina algiphila]